MQTPAVYPGTAEPTDLANVEISQEERDLFLQVANERGSHELHRSVQLLARARRDAEARAERYRALLVRQEGGAAVLRSSNSAVKCPSQYKKTFSWCTLASVRASVRLNISYIF